MQRCRSQGNSCDLGSHQNFRKPDTLDFPFEHELAEFLGSLLRRKEHSKRALLGDRVVEQHLYELPIADRRPFGNLTDQCRAQEEARKG